MVAAWECAMGRREGGSSCLCHLPAELLQIIISRLSILDYIFCRVVCKCWRSAFSLCSSETTFPNLAHNQSPWFLILSTEIPAEMSPYAVPEPCLLTTGKFGNLATGHIHTTNMPELCGTFVVLSKHGWLLLFDSPYIWSTMFFFDMFSRARISLPFFFYYPDSWSPVYDISAPPTSPDCVVFIMSLITRGFQVRLCSRKDPSWTTLEFHIGIKREPEPELDIENLIFVKGIWYCLHSSGDISTFDVANQSFKFLGRPRGLVKNDACMSYVLQCGDDQVRLRFHAFEECYEIALVDPLRVVRCSEETSDFEQLLRSDVARFMKTFPDALAIDSFNPESWCVTFGPKSNDMHFRRHPFHAVKGESRNQQDQAKETGNLCPLAIYKCSTNIMWVKPTRVHSFSNLRWRLS